jgi:hypothetical protein
MKLAKGKQMFENRKLAGQRILGCSAVLLLTAVTGCTHKTESAELKKMPPNAQFSGFLSKYDVLKQSSIFENTLTYVKQDDAKNVHKYYAVIIDPVEIYAATNADTTKIPDRGRTALAEYFHNAITRAVSDAFPVAREPGPLVLRLRTALIGVDTASQPTGEKGDDALEHGVDIGKVGVEMEMVDSVTGEQIVAAVDRQNLGQGAVVGSVNFSRDQKFEAAKEACDGWAARLRDFLDSAQDLSAEDSKRADASYKPYGDAPRAK